LAVSTDVIAELAIALEVMVDMRGWPAGVVQGVAA
jgi:hypothetical protein